MSKLQDEFERWYCNKYKLPMFVIRDFRGLPGYFEKKSKWLEQKLEEKNKELNREMVGAFRPGKTYKQFCNFIKVIKEGKKVAMVGKDYVVIDRKTYDRLTQGSRIKK